MLYNRFILGQIEEDVSKMSNTNVSNDTNMSKSAAKRNKRKQEAAALKRKNQSRKIIITAVVAFVCVVLVWAIASEIIFKLTKTEPSNNFSALLTEEGKIEGINADKLTKDKGYESLVVPASEIEFTDEEVEAEIKTLLESNQALNKDTTVAVADGDKINLDYVGYMDGVAFEGGNTKGNGATLTIGSGQYIGDFETQLIGTHPGDEVTVNVTFPDNYPKNPDYAGKEATFEVVVNGIYYTPEFDDAFVAEHLSEDAGTAEEYKTFLKESNYQANLEEYLGSYIANNAEISSYPDDYVKELMAIQRYVDESNYKYYNDYYSQALGSKLYNDFEDYTGMSEKKYEKELKKMAKLAAATNITYEYLYDKYNLTVSDETYAEVVEMYGTDAETIYGKPYLMQAAIKETVVAYLSTVVTIQ